MVDAEVLELLLLDVVAAIGLALAIAWVAVTG
jgi:hypothetical protein